MREARLSALGEERSPAEVRRVVHDVVRRIGARLPAMLEPGVTPNFHAAMIQEPARRGAVSPIYLLHSRDYDAWAVAVPQPRFAPAAGDALPSGWMHLHQARFLDHDGVFAALAELHGIEAWSSYDLEQPVPAGIALRASGDMAYWEPRRLGDVLFNWWD
ncbi:hypothetical protein J5226_10770 [Lysobacter sp. K5869]|uniref:hypothetical protein n=1 Tax=Lysobacter sp. K5869 TaxID=2820808 RepID=UPI001C05FC8D|nr:hypothetical protein [Lysobacter sp. K5869]QWP78835.1 hypothetical protein J5226_10770 [Lysobacter sp. K5869]